jgi:NADPH:quinone reductase-like Zn-dependent oxidoreductase
VKAVVRDKFGGPEMLEIEDVPKPELTDDSVLVRVRAASLNLSDWYGMTGRPYVGRVSMGLRRPKERLLGTDFAGIAEAVGKDVTHIRPGDEVFGGRSGALAEYVSVKNAVALKPANVTFEEAASVPIAATTALQGLRDKGELQAGQRVLVHGASGGVGTFAVQIAKALGADVTAVCGTGNVEIAHTLGADHVVDYTKEDCTRNGRRYDLLLDVRGGRSWSDCKRSLEDGGVLVAVGGPRSNRLLGPLAGVIRLRLRSIGGNRKVAFFIAKLTRDDMEVLRELLEAGKIKPVVDRRFELSEIADAFAYMGDGHPRGKIVVSI